MAKLGKTTFAGAGAAAIIAIVAALQPHEHRVYVPYWDKLGGVWTVCAGVTGPGVVPGRTYSDAECVSMESAYVAEMLQAMGQCVHAPLEFHEIKAWGHFAYNVGTPSFCNSTAARLLNEGQNKRACAEISRWVFIGGKDCRLSGSKCAGIPVRRAWERATCEGEDE